MVDEQARREAAVKRLEARRDFWNHLFIYLAVTNGGGYFWPIWPMAGWGIGVLAHAWETFRRPIGEEAIRREMERGSA